MQYNFLNPNSKEDSIHPRPTLPSWQNTVVFKLEFGNYKYITQLYFEEIKHYKVQFKIQR